MQSMKHRFPQFRLMHTIFGDIWRPVKGHGANYRHRGLGNRYRRMLNRQ